MKASRDRAKEDRAGQIARPGMVKREDWAEALAADCLRGRQECRVLIERSEQLLRELLGDIPPNGSVQ